jgi:hypothetical protein
MFDWESDFFAISKSKYSIEVEVKISRSDFFNDFKKNKHNIMSKRKNKWYIRNDGTNENGGGYIMTPEGPDRYKRINLPYSTISFHETNKILPNKFFFAVPEGLISVEEVPEYAGLIYINGYQAQVMKNAPFLHKNKICFTEKLLSKYYSRAVNAISHLSYINHYDDDRTKDNINKAIRILK